MEIIGQNKTGFLNAICNCGKACIVDKKYLSHCKRFNREPLCKNCQNIRRSNIRINSFDYSKYYLKKYGKLTVTSTFYDSKRTKGKKRRFVCICDCGSQYICSMDDLIYGGTISCGCYRSEQAIVMGESSKIHGHTCKDGIYKRTRVYVQWDKIRNLCARGWERQFHTVCHEYDKKWDNFIEFFKDFGDVKENETISRLDNQMPWTKENCYIRTLY